MPFSIRKCCSAFKRLNEKNINKPQVSVDNISLHPENTMDSMKEEYEIQYYDFCLHDFAEQSNN